MQSSALSKRSALLIVDVQEQMMNAIAAGRPQANPRWEENIVALASAFRERGLPVLHVLHDDPRPESPFRRDKPSGQPVASTAPIEGERVFWKTGSSAFVGTELEAHARAEGIESFVVVGGVAAFCVNSSARSAANLGFGLVVPEDALLAFAMPARGGGDLDANVVLEVTLAALAADFGEVMPTADVLAEIDPS